MRTRSWQTAVERASGGSADPYGNMRWYGREKTKHKGKYHEPKSVIAHNRDLYENRSDREQRYNERDQSYPNQNVGG
jgi:hypothetical protein